MSWILMVALAALIFVSSMTKAQEKGIWSWSKFVFAVSFAVLEGLLISAPLVLMNTNSPYFVPVYIAVVVVAASLFVLFVMKARRWTRPGG
jgi:hypothetical protein